VQKRKKKNKMKEIDHKETINKKEQKENKRKITKQKEK
jgi:hypothetical protein